MEEPQENSMLASIRPNLHLRRKSMPAITGLDTFALSRIAESAAAASEAEAATSSTQARTSLEMDGSLHLISFFENPLGVGSIYQGSRTLGVWTILLYPDQP